MMAVAWKRKLDEQSFRFRRNTLTLDTVQSISADIQVLINRIDMLINIHPTQIHGKQPTGCTMSYQLAHGRDKIGRDQVTLTKEIVKINRKFHLRNINNPIKLGSRYMLPHVES